jgi:hypothetical protein
MAKYSFWSDASLEPKRNFRFTLLMNGIPSWLIKKVNKPAFKINEAKHQYLGHTFYYPGNVEYEPVTITLVDPLTPDASRTIMNHIAASGYKFPLDATSTSTVSKVNAVAALGNLTVEQIDADGNIADKWTYKNAWISDVKFGELAYEDNNLTEITLTVRYDWAEMDVPGPEAGGQS